MKILVVAILAMVSLTSCKREGSGINSEFRKHVLTTEFISEGVAVGDVNNDGKLDILAGTYWFEAPDWSKHEIDSSKTFDPDTEYSDSFLNFSADINHDQWIDLIVVDFPGTFAIW